MQRAVLLDPRARACVCVRVCSAFDSDWFFSRFFLFFHFCSFFVKKHTSGAAAYRKPAAVRRPTAVAQAIDATSAFAPVFDDDGGLALAEITKRRLRPFCDADARQSGVCDERRQRVGRILCFVSIFLLKKGGKIFFGDVYRL